MASKNIGIPIKVLHDAEGHTVTVELKSGEVYRGKLDEAEDNMNVHLSNCTKTLKDGRVQMLSKCAAPRRTPPAGALPHATRLFHAFKLAASPMTLRHLPRRPPFAGG